LKHNPDPFPEKADLKSLFIEWFLYIDQTRMLVYQMETQDSRSHFRINGGDYAANWENRLASFPIQ